MARRFILLFLGCLCFTGVLNACGIKPGKVQPPENVQSDTFPRTYPVPHYMK